MKTTEWKKIVLPLAMPVFFEKQRNIAKKEVWFISRSSERPNEWKVLLKMQYTHYK